MTYKPPLFLGNSHLATLYPVFFRKVEILASTRQRLDTSDGDFLDVDCYLQGSAKVVILTHGLEGDSRRPYIRAMAKTFFDQGYDVLAWNCRSCSGEMNRTMGLYHSGFTTDLNRIVEFAGNYSEISLIGFSMGGNITMKYLGENELYPLARKIHKAVSISAPLDLKSCAVALKRRSNKIYVYNFLSTLKEKVRCKMNLHSDYPVDRRALDKARDFHDFDEVVTAPVFGFKNAEDYWEKNSARFFLNQVKVPSLLLSSLNDPMLGSECFVLDAPKNVEYDYTNSGGHVGFIQFGKAGLYWTEERALKFIKGL